MTMHDYNVGIYPRTGPRANVVHASLHTPKKGIQLHGQRGGVLTLLRRAGHAAGSYNHYRNSYKKT